MDDFELRTLAKKYRQSLLDDVVGFWLKNSIDTQYGGYFTCLGRDGLVYDSDKFVWLQARQVWTLCMLHENYPGNQLWLETARSGIDFLSRNGMDEQGNWYFALDRSGRPLVQPYNIFSDCFAAMAFGRYAIVTGDSQARDIALATYANILTRADNPKGPYNKVISSTRPMVSLGLPMILANLTLEIEPLLKSSQAESALNCCVSQVLELFVDKSRLLVFENVAPDGSHTDCFEGRLINPGHGIEAMWFLIEVAAKLGDKKLIERAVDVILRTLEFSWDPQYGGIFYFLDAEGKPPVQLEWSQKLWWVHFEALVALIKAYAHTQQADCLRWFRKVDDYLWSRFADPEYGEFFGYLDRRGDVLSQAKGGKWKGFFHVPRALHLCHTELAGLTE